MMQWSPIWLPTKAVTDISSANAPIIGGEAMDDKAAGSGRLYRKRSISRRMAGTRTQELSSSDFTTENGTQTMQINRT
jgi:hypothetical protein